LLYTRWPTSAHAGVFLISCLHSLRGNDEAASSFPCAGATAWTLGCLIHFVQSWRLFTFLTTPLRNQAHSLQAILIQLHLVCRKELHMRHRPCFALLALLALSPFPGCSGQRYINVQIERDGVVVLQTEYGVSDSMDAAAMWNTLQGQSFAAANPIKSEPEDPKKAVLKGKLRMVILHVKTEIASAKISELRLVRDSDTADRWNLAPGEVDRTSHVAGL
jgi:hypothetical protein